MAIPAGGTFDYVAIVPDRSGDEAFECLAQVREPIDRSDSRLVGIAPVLRVTNAGPTPNPGPRPSVIRSCITLAAATRRQANVRAASFYLDKTLTSSLKPRDVIHLARTTCGGLGLSVIREGELVVAVGAVTAVPLGRAIDARIATELIARALAVSRQRAPDFEFPELPFKFSVNGSDSVRYGDWSTLEQYVIFASHGFLERVVPGVDECAAICQKGTCPEEAAKASAMLLERQGISLSRW